MVVDQKDENRKGGGPLRFEGGVRGDPYAPQARKFWRLKEPPPLEKWGVDFQGGGYFSRVSPDCKHFCQKSDQPCLSCSVGAKSCTISLERLKYFCRWFDFRNIPRGLCLATTRRIHPTPRLGANQNICLDTAISLLFSKCLCLLCAVCLLACPRLPGRPWQPPGTDSWSPRRPELSNLAFPGAVEVACGPAPAAPLRAGG